MVDTREDGSHSAALCPSCHDSIVVLGKIPKLSIAAGVDFGHFNRLGLTHPNLHEQLVLSRTRLYFSMFKISSNAKGQVNMNTQNKVRCHSILFPHDAPGVSSHMFGSDLRGPDGLLELSSLRRLLHLYMVDPQGRPDAIAQDIFRTVNLLARPHVIAQWLITLKWLHPFYADIDVTDIQRTTRETLGMLNKEIIDSCSAIDDPDAVEHEMGLGSDVAQVRNIEITDPAAVRQRQMEMDQDRQQEFTAAPGFNDISYSFVTNADTAYYTGGEEDFRLRALEAFADYYSGDDGPGTDDDGCCNFNEDNIRDYLQRNPMSGSHFTAREERPLVDFERDDRGITTSFPQIFLLGRAYARAPGNLSSDQRFHLLNQFHMTPSRDRRLLGFLFDVRQRAQVMNGVKARVEGNKTSIKHITALLQQP
jgi:hypothetical protein